MAIHDEFKEAISSLDIAERELYDAQSKNNPEEFNQARYKLNLAQSLLNNLDIDELTDDQQIARVRRAKEHLKHLLEAQISIQ
ncbi:hypothetical protein PY093_09360 [Cytobacillus sp. S13-E01]|uniref:hypothetical protein n=1 Tax=Cytobacillus sp. S13-E01 TaxID=3031326 RepID=UPI0023D829DE|nr:hypothetical protein [Cytobacillus sp. S13-E01]MDF0726922.1 hypothetical protein [Cytobacillus sp. S13-E01]